jgi:sugar phosphate isomerase/epimerase
MKIGYNTNGFAHHRLEDTLAILSELGYSSVAITLDHRCLNPFDPDIGEQATRVRALLKILKLSCVIETGARFLLDPRRKHQPTLLSRHDDDRNLRLDFLLRAINLAALLEADAVSFWSGTPAEPSPHALSPGGARGDDACWKRLVGGCAKLCEEATKRGVRLAFEPEPGMFIDTMAKFADLHSRVGHPSFGLTLDVGHLHCQDETPIADHIHRWKDWLWNVHIEDMRRGVHDHLMFGEGEMDFPPIVRALGETNYAGGVHVELSRHSHDAVNTARRAMDFLRPLAINP